MKATGMVRKVDNLGRVVLPIELRRSMGIGDNDPLEVFVDTDKIILKKHEPGCTFCGEADDVTMFNGKRVCESCRVKMAQAG